MRHCLHGAYHRGPAVIRLWPGRVTAGSTRLASLAPPPAAAATARLTRWSRLTRWIEAPLGYRINR